MKQENLREWERMTTGRLYNSCDAAIAKRHLRGMARCERFNRISVRRGGAKQRALERLIPSAKGKTFGVFSPFYCEYGVNIHVGEECFVNYNCIFLDVAPITLGIGVWLGANVTLATPNHPFLAEERLPLDFPDGRHNLEYAEPITIEDGCWICSGVTVCGGVTIGKNSIVAAGAVVTGDIPPNSIAAGIPARVLRPLTEADRLQIRQAYQNDRPVSRKQR